MADKKRDFPDELIFLDESGVVKDGFCLEDYFYMQNLKNRKIYFNCAVSIETVSGIVMHIHQINEEDRGKDIKDRKPIILYIASNGGDVDAGFALIDAIETSKTPVYTVNISNMYSMGFLIGLAGHKRFTMKNSKFLMHDGSNCVYNSGAKAQDQMEFNRRTEERIRQYVLDNTKITQDEYDSKLRVEWYMFAEEAKELGCVDYIVGVDCDMDDIQ